MNEELGVWARAAVDRLLERVMRGMASQYEAWALELRREMRRC
jgi:hypothetical protein